MVIAQVALSVVLLTAAGLFVTSLVNLRSLNLGFDRDHVLMVALDPARSGYTGEQLARGCRELLERFQSFTGVRSASLCWIAPVSGAGTMFWLSLRTTETCTPSGSVSIISSSVRPA